MAINRPKAILGFGVTGQSVARFLQRQKIEFEVFDFRTDENPKWQRQFSNTDFHFGNVHESELSRFDELIVSPGISLKLPVLQNIQRQKQKKMKLINDIELFAWELNQQELSKPLVAISGTNAKSTVASLLELMVLKSGLRVAVGGNLDSQDRPDWRGAALDLLAQACDLYILELSSFQLELTKSLKPTVSALLNVSQDHLDRYSDIEEYQRIKQRVFIGAGKAIFNRQDEGTRPKKWLPRRPLNSFGLEAPADSEQWGMRTVGSRQYLAKGKQLIMPADEVGLDGLHSRVNALAALSIADALKCPLEAACEALREFKGLPHRCERLRTTQAAGGGIVHWINDSKATNTGSTLAALNSFGSDERNIILIAGGLGKEQDFSQLKGAIARYVKQLLLIGENAELLYGYFKGLLNGLAIKVLGTLDRAVEWARSTAKAGDIVLLSPACSSLDQFTSYRDRGDHFRKRVEVL